ncbi:MAG: hypothetical protein ACJ72N_07560 [Labedaea sp.]|jgi:hypothetical protein
MNDELSTSRQPLPLAWIERISAHMLLAYGKKYTDLWAVTKPDAWKKYWSEQLAGFSAAEIKRGMEALDGREWPPTLPEFKRLCRPPLDPSAAFYEALEGVQARERGERGEWSHPAIYWTAVRIGAHDLKSSGYAQIQRRWESALQAILDAGSYAPIPNPAPALPAPGKAALTREKEARLMAELGASGLLRRKADPRAWIARIRERQQAGDRTLSIAAIRMADAAEAIDPNEHDE